MKVKSESEVTQLCPTLSDPMDCSLPGSSIHGIFQARVLEWGAIAFSKLSTTVWQTTHYLLTETGVYYLLLAFAKCCPDLGWPWPTTAWSGAWVPSQRLRSDHGGESSRSSPLDQWSVTRALTLWLCRKEFPQRQKVVKQVKYSFGGKEYSTCG